MDNTRELHFDEVYKKAHPQKDRNRYLSSVQANKETVQHFISRFLAAVPAKYIEMHANV